MPSKLDFLLLSAACCQHRAWNSFIRYGALYVKSSDVTWFWPFMMKFYCEIDRLRAHALETPRTNFNVQECSCNSSFLALYGRRAADEWIVQCVAPVCDERPQRTASSSWLRQKCLTCVKSNDGRGWRLLFIYLFSFYFTVIKGNMRRWHTHISCKTGFDFWCKYFVGSSGVLTKLLTSQMTFSYPSVISSFNRPNWLWINA